MTHMFPPHSSRTPESTCDTPPNTTTLSSPGEGFCSLPLPKWEISGCCLLQVPQDPPSLGWSILTESVSSSGKETEILTSQPRRYQGYGGCPVHLASGQEVRPSQEVGGQSLTRAKAGRGVWQEVEQRAKCDPSETLSDHSD